MTHRSRLAGFIIDCEAGDLDAAAEFWTLALGDAKRRNGLHGEIQRVDHPGRVRLDIASDAAGAEVAGPEKLGARRAADVRSWAAMEAPTGHRFCVIGAPGRDFADTANEWSDA
jgi:hypothetical protein